MVWMNTCLFYVRNSKLDTARSVFQKALTAIDKKERKYHTHTVQYSKYTWDAFISCFFTFKLKILGPLHAVAVSCSVSSSSSSSYLVTLLKFVLLFSHFLVDASASAAAIVFSLSSLISALTKPCKLRKKRRKPKGGQWILSWLYSSVVWMTLCPTRIFSPLLTKDMQHDYDLPLMLLLLFSFVQYKYCTVFLQHVVFSFLFIFLFIYSFFFCLFEQTSTW